MKKVKVKVLKSNQKGNAFECSVYNQTFWVQKRSLGKGDMVNDKVINKALIWIKDLEQEKIDAKKSIKFTKIDETEKAVKAMAILTCNSTDQQRKRNFFIPKSILENGEMPAWFADKKRKELNDNESYQGLLT